MEIVIDTSGFRNLFKRYKIGPLHEITFVRPNKSIMPRLTETQIAEQLATVPTWQLKETAIARQFQFKDFPGSIQFVNQVAEAAEAAWHHPDIDVRWNKVHLVLTTHDEGGLTIKDFDLARSFDKIVDVAASGDSPSSQGTGN